MSTIGKEERQFNLILTLIAYPHGIKRDDLLSIVPGYQEDFDRFAEVKNAGVLRNFERDKVDIAALGITIQTTDENESLNDNQNTRYFIRESDYDFPEGVTFSQEEMSLLRSAAQAWRDGSMNLESRKALTKLRSLGFATDDRLVGVAPSMSRTDDAFDALHDAYVKQCKCSFLYLKPGEDKPAKRSVVPVALSDVFGQWHVYSYDLDRKAFRTFLLSRIVTTPVVIKGRLDVPAEDYSAVLAAELRALALNNQARLQLTPNTDAYSRLVARYGAADANDSVSVQFTDLNVFADELCEFGPHVTIHDNDELAEALASRLRLIASNHGALNV